MPCDHCGTLVDYQPWDFRFCPGCNGLLGGDESKSRWIDNPSSSKSHPEMVLAADENLSEEVPEPESKAYEGVEMGSLLALIGERLVCSDLPGNGS